MWCHSQMRLQHYVRYQISYVRYKVKSSASWGAVVVDLRSNVRLNGGAKAAQGSDLWAPLCCKHSCYLLVCASEDHFKHSVLCYSGWFLRVVELSMLSITWWLSARQQTTEAGSRRAVQCRNVREWIFWILLFCRQAKSPNWNLIDLQYRMNIFLKRAIIKLIH